MSEAWETERKKKEKEKSINARHGIHHHALYSRWKPPLRTLESRSRINREECKEDDFSEMLE